MHHGELNKIFRHKFGFNVPLDMTLAVIHGPMNAKIDILKLEKELAKKDPEFDPENCTYKGHPMPTDEYIEIKYGIDAVKLVNQNM